MASDSPSRLYKFYPDHNQLFIEEFQAQDISNRKAALSTPYFYCPSPKELNDPFEFRIKVDDLKSPEELFAFINEFNQLEGRKTFTHDQFQRLLADSGVARLIDEMTSRIEFVRDYTLGNMRVACFTERYNSILMWSHYGHSHKGFCLRFDLDEMEDIASHLLKVSYSKSDKFPQITPMDIVRNHKQSSEKTLKTMLSHKHKGWSYEKEWRVLSREPQLKYDSSAVTDVLLGCNSSEDLLLELRSYFPSAKFLKAKRAERSFQLEFNELE